MQVNINGIVAGGDTTYNDWFWKQVIGACVGMGLIFFSLTGFWIYY